MSEFTHTVDSRDATVRGYPGTVSTCTCGWRSEWAVRDGSAESDAHGHMRAVDPEYRRLDDERHARWKAEHEARVAARLSEPPRAETKPVTRCHECSCHINPPCSRCENCKHGAGDINDCPNDCEDCDVKHY